MRLWILIVGITTLLLVGCSGGSQTPVTTQPAGTLDSLPVIGAALYDDGGFNAIGMLGAYEVTIDPEKGTADLIAKRTPALGEDYIVSGIGFFTIRPCTTCLKLTAISVTPDGNALLTFSIKHPFAMGVDGLPPSGSNRKDLNVFDLAAVVAPSGTTATTYSLTGTDVYASACYGADGYTTELANVLTPNDAALPYFLVIDDSVTGTGTFNKFAQGASASFDIGFDLDAGTLAFDLYLTMGYGASAKKAQRLTPTYHNPEFNRKPAWKIAVTPPQGTDLPIIGNTWQDNDSTTLYNVKVEVWDWQVDAVVDPTLVNPAAVYAASEVESVSVEIPGMNTTALPSVTTDDGTGAGTPASPLVYLVPVANENLLVPGVYAGLVKVTDTRPVLTPTDGRDFLIDSPDGIALNNYAIPEYATYQIFPATVVLGCGPITGAITTPNCPVSGVANGSTINFEVTATSDNGGLPITEYQADLDYDGTTFDVDATNATGIFTNLGPFTVPDPCGDNVPTTYTVAFRAIDSCDPPNQTVFAECEVTVDICLQPVGNVVLTVNRETSGLNYQIMAATPWTLSWTAAGGAVEYAIYCDTNPADGLTNNLVYSGATTALTYNCPAADLIATHYVIGNTYVVRSRSIAGDAGSEAANSQLAHVMTNGWETLGTYVNPGEGWTSNCEIGQNFYICFPYTGTSYVAQGSRSLQFTPFCGTSYMSYAGRWNGITKPTPTIADSTVRRMEASLYNFQTGAPNGLIFGTCSNLPTYPFSTPTNIDWSTVDSTGGFQAYNTSAANVTATFDSVGSGNNSWTGYIYRVKVGGDVNAGGNPADANVAIEFVKLDAGNQPYPFFDEVTIAIY